MNIFKKSRSKSPSNDMTKNKKFSDRKKSVSEVVSDRLMPPVELRGRSSSFDNFSSAMDGGESLSVPFSASGRSSSVDTVSQYNLQSSDENLSDKETNYLKVPKYQRRRSSLEIPKICIHCVHIEALEHDRIERENLLRQNNLLNSVQSFSDESSTFDSDSSDGFYESESDDEASGSEKETNYKTLHIKQSNQLKDSDGSVYTDVVTLEVPVIKQYRSSSLDIPYRDTQVSSDPRGSSENGTTLQVPKQVRSSSVDVALPTNENGHYKAITDVSNTKAIATSSPSFTTYLHPAHAEQAFRKRELLSHVDWTENALSAEHVWVETNASGDYCCAMEIDCIKTGPRKKCIACKIIAHVGCVSILEMVIASHRTEFIDACAKASESNVDKLGRSHSFVMNKYLPSVLQGLTDNTTIILLGKVPNGVWMSPIVCQKNLKCKPTFREAGVRNYREQALMRHHWVHRRRQEGKCKQCGKSFQQRFAFQRKEIIAISCSWCKAAYHNKISCFMRQQIEEQCLLGAHSSIIIPPTWIIKLPRKGSFKSSLRKKRRSTVKKKRSSIKEEHRSFIIKPIPSPVLKPLLVFINPKSGGNQGAKLYHKFCWLLNPRQVFDLSRGGPRYGLELYRKVPNLQILACGGDGTVGWILSLLDELAINPQPPVAIIPLGTGNDMSRTLNWGAGYADEPLSKMLSSLEESQVVQLDRWNVTVESDDSLEVEMIDESVAATLPQNVFNNYFSLGADAQVALEFHESREANPEKFNSRFRNKMFYAGAGGRDYLRRSCKSFSDHVTVLCDGVDLTPRIQDLKLHCLLFLNIPRYGSGTAPWGSSTAVGFEPQRYDDGFMEVIGFTYSTLATLQIGGHGERLVQAREVVLKTSRTLPMQVDGEPCRLRPSTIKISMRNQANMILKPKRRGSVPISNDSPSVPERLRLQVSRIHMGDYETHHYDKDKLRQVSVPLGIIVVDNNSDLEHVRQQINKMRQDIFGVEDPPVKWSFLDSTTAERFFRIDRSQEQAHYITDISSEDLYILDPSLDRSYRIGIKENGHHNTSMDVDKTAPERVEEEMTTIQIETNFQERKNEELVFSFNMPVTPPRSPADPTSCLRRPESKENLLVPPLCPGSNNSSEPGSPNADNSETKHMQFVSVASASSNNVNNNKPLPLSPPNKLLIDASKRGDLKKLIEMYQCGADLLATDQYGMTSLHHAARFGHKDIVKYLVDQAPPVILDMVDHEKGQTALHKAAWYQRRTICCTLVEAGASLTRTDYQGNTPRTQALRAEDKELAAYLESQEHYQLVAMEDQETAV